MKFRQGFVSNSSSSSFTYVIKKEYFDDFEKTLEIYEQELFDWLNKMTNSIDGISYYVFSGRAGNCSSFDDFEFEIELTDKQNEILENEGAHQMFDNVVSRMNKYKYIEVEVDF